MEGTHALQTQNLAGGGISDLRKPYEISRRCSAHHIMIYTMSGQGRLTQPQPRQELTPGSVCLLPAGLDHAYGTDSTWNVFWFHMVPTSAWEGLMPDHVMRVPALWSEPLKTLSEEFLRETVQRNRISHHSILEGYARLIVLFLRRELNFHERSGHSEHRRRLEHLWHLVSENPERDWSVDALARSGHFSRSNLQLLTHHIYGCGVMEMVIRLRMERAASLILQHQLKLADIAESIGYQSPFSFSNAFKRTIGVSPQAYRREQAM